MSYIAAAGAKNRVNAYFGNDTFNPYDTVGSAMKSSAAEYVAKTENEAKRDYFGTVGQAKLDGIKEYGSAQTSAGNDAFMGSLFELGGGLAQGVSSFGVKNWGWGKPKT